MPIFSFSIETRTSMTFTEQQRAMVEDICAYHAGRDFQKHVRRWMRKEGIVQAVRDRNTPKRSSG
jgi:hypothetical protein